MPYDPQAFDPEDDEARDGASLGRRRRFKDFECPDCDAMNPYDDGFGDGDEILCYYCGQQFEVRVTDEGRLKLREA